MPSHQRFMATVLATSASLLLALFAPRANAAKPGPKPDEPRRIAVTVADDANLQHAPFWLAVEAGFFAKHNLVVEPKTVGRPRELLGANAAPWDAAILPPPIYLQLLADDATGDKYRLAASLMRGDPITLVVRKAVADQVPALDPKSDLATRLRALAGKKIAVAPGPLSRLRALWQSANVPFDEAKQLVIVAGPEQNAYLHDGKMDAVLAHTPYAERAIRAGDGVAWYTIGNQPMAPYRVREGHALVVQKALADRDPKLVADLVKALDDARDYLKTHRADAAAKLAAKWNRPVAEVELGLTLLDSTWPASTEPSLEGLESELQLFPASQPRPTIAREKLQRAILKRSK